MLCVFFWREHLLCCPMWEPLATYSSSNLNQNEMKHKIQFSFVLITFQVINSHYVAGGYHVGQHNITHFHHSRKFYWRALLVLIIDLEGSVTPKVFTYYPKNSEWVLSLNKLPEELPKSSTFAKPCVLTHNLKSQKRIKTEAKQALLIYWLSSQTFPHGIFPPQAVKILMTDLNDSSHFRMLLLSPTLR